MLFVQVFYNDDRPSSTLPWAGKFALVSIFKTILKIALALFIMIDKSMKQRQWMNIALTGYSFFFLFLRYRESQLKNRLVLCFYLFEESNLFCIYGIATLNMAISGSEHLLYVILCMCPIIFLAFLFIIEWRNRSVLTNILPKDIKSREDAEYYIDTLIAYLGNTIDNHNYIILTGILITHCK